MYHSLVGNERFKSIYQIQEDPAFTLSQLEKEIEELVLGRQVTTVADEEYDELIDSEITKIVVEEMRANSEHSGDVKALMKRVIQKLRDFEFELTEDKYLLVMSCLTQ